MVPKSSCQAQQSGSFHGAYDLNTLALDGPHRGQQLRNQASGSANFCSEFREPSWCQSLLCSSSYLVVVRRAGWAKSPSLLRAVCLAPVLLCRRARVKKRLLLRIPAHVHEERACVCIFPGSLGLEVGGLWRHENSFRRILKGTVCFRFGCKICHD